MVVTDRPVHKIVRKASSHLIHKIYMHILCLKSCQSTSLMVICLLLLPWCTTITGYRISSNNSNSQQQPTASYRQTSKFLPEVSGPTREKTTTNSIYMWQFQVCYHYTYCSMYEEWFKLWLHRWNSLLPVNKQGLCHTSPAIYRNFTSTISYTIH